MVSARAATSRLRVSCRCRGHVYQRGEPCDVILTSQGSSTARAIGLCRAIRKRLTRTHGALPCRWIAQERLVRRLNAQAPPTFTRTTKFRRHGRASRAKSPGTRSLPRATFTKQRRLHGWFTASTRNAAQHFCESLGRHWQAHRLLLPEGFSEHVNAVVQFQPAVETTAALADSRRRSCRSILIPGRDAGGHAPWDTHYGVIPWNKQPSLYKASAERSYRLFPACPQTRSVGRSARMARFTTASGCDLDRRRARFSAPASAICSNSEKVRLASAICDEIRQRRRRTGA